MSTYDKKKRGGQTHFLPLGPSIWDSSNYVSAKPDQLGGAVVGAEAPKRPLFCHWGLWVSHRAPIIHPDLLQTLQDPPTSLLPGLGSHCTEAVATNQETGHQPWASPSSSSWVFPFGP